MKIVQNNAEIKNYRGRYGKQLLPELIIKTAFGFTPNSLHAYIEIWWVNMDHYENVKT